jgi:chromosome segregation ATPase
VASFVCHLVDYQGDNRDHEVVERIEQLRIEDKFASDLVEGKIDEAEARANSIMDNPEVIKMYQKRKAEIDQRTKELERLQGECQNRQSTLDKLKGPWNEKLQNVVHKLNERFSVYMMQMSCAGEVVLDTDEADYAAWGIKIRVRRGFTYVQA